MNTRNGMWKDFASASRSPPTSNMDRVEIKTSTVVFNDSENDFQVTFLLCGLANTVLIFWVQMKADRV